jgi:hypothetical protein
LLGVDRKKRRRRRHRTRLGIVKQQKPARGYCLLSQPVANRGRTPVAFRALPPLQRRWGRRVIGPQQFQPSPPERGGGGLLRISHCSGPISTMLQSPQLFFSGLSLEATQTGLRGGIRHRGFGGGPRRSCERNFSDTGRGWCKFACNSRISEEGTRPRRGAQRREGAWASNYSLISACVPRALSFAPTSPRDPSLPLGKSHLLHDDAPRNLWQLAVAHKLKIPGKSSSSI